jgi:tRNA pseudouridine38-40 synthase
VTAPAPRRVRLDLAYDGTAYAGWQVQPGQRTIQGTLEALLERLQGGVRSPLRAAGRTDAGVHARGQVADAVVALRHDDRRLAHALGRLLPRDIRVLEVRTVDPTFDARRHARAKTYAYRIDRTAHGDPFLARFALHVPWPLERRRIEDALALLPGRRDWSAFTASACEIEDRVRELTEARLEEAGAGELRFVFTADGFLTHMVRALVGTLLEVGRGRMTAEAVREALARRERALAGPTAPAHGLVLEHVRYG